MYDDILVPTDGSEGVQEAIDHGIDLAALAGATVHGLFVVDTTDAAAIPDPQWVTMEETLEEAGQRAVDDVRERARARDVEADTEIRRGTPHDEIVAYAEETGADLIVMGTHGRSGIDRVLLGSVTDNVVRQADRPVLVKRIEED